MAPMTMGAANRGGRTTSPRLLCHGVKRSVPAGDDALSDETLVLYSIFFEIKLPTILILFNSTSSYASTVEIPNHRRHE